MKNRKMIRRILFSILFLLVVQIAYSIPAPSKWIEAKWGAGDLITFVGTMMLGIVAWRQSENATEMNRRIVDSERKRNYKADLTPKSIAFTTYTNTPKDCLHILLHHENEENTSRNKYNMNMQFILDSKQNRDSIERIKLETFVMQKLDTKNQFYTHHPSDWIDCRTENDYYPLMPTVITKEQTQFKLNAVVSIPCDIDALDITDMMQFRVILVLSYKNIFDVVCETRYSMYFERAYNGLMDEKFFVIEEDKPLAIHVNKIFVEQ